MLYLSPRPLKTTTQKLATFFQHPAKGLEGCKKQQRKVDKEVTDRAEGTETSQSCRVGSPVGRKGDGLEVRINGDRINGGFVGVTTYSLYWGII